MHSRIRPPLYSQCLEKLDEIRFLHVPQAAARVAYCNDSPRRASWKRCRRGNKAGAATKRVKVLCGTFWLHYGTRRADPCRLLRAGGEPAKWVHSERRCMSACGKSSIGQDRDGRIIEIH